MTPKPPIQNALSTPVILLVIYGGLNLFALLLSPLHPRLSEPSGVREPARKNPESKPFRFAKNREPLSSDNALCCVSSADATQFNDANALMISSWTPTAYPFVLHCTLKLVVAAET